MRYNTLNVFIVVFSFLPSPNRIYRRELLSLLIFIPPDYNQRISQLVKLNHIPSHRIATHSLLHPVNSSFIHDTRALTLTH